MQKFINIISILPFFQDRVFQDLGQGILENALQVGTTECFK